MKKKDLDSEFNTYEILTEFENILNSKEISDEISKKHKLDNKKGTNNKDNKNDKAKNSK